MFEYTASVTICKSVQPEIRNSNRFASFLTAVHYLGLCDNAGNPLSYVVSLLFAINDFHFEEVMTVTSIVLDAGMREYFAQQDVYC
jgi:hypothetical protein